MADIYATAAQHLEVLAGTFAPYETLTARIVAPIGKPAHLRVAAGDLPDLVEEITCVPDHDRPGSVVYLWSWGDRIHGQGLADMAAAVAHVLNTGKHEQG